MRSAIYFIKRIMRLSTSPHTVAIGVAAGVFASWTPLVGFHFFVAAILAFLFAGNIVASAIGTAVGNPLTFPFIWLSTYKLGRFLLGTETYATDQNINLFHHFRDSKFHQLWEPLVKPMFIGSLPLGFVCAAIFYTLTYWGVKRFKRRHFVSVDKS